jgi:hypothetical protein
MFEDDDVKRSMEEDRQSPILNFDFTQSITEASSGSGSGCGRATFDYSSTCSDEMESNEILFKCTDTDTDTDANANADTFTYTRDHSAVHNSITTEEFEYMKIERDLAIEKAEETKSTLKLITEAVQILCRQMKNTCSEFQQIESQQIESTSSKSLSSDSYCDGLASFSQESTTDHSASKPPLLPAPAGNRSRTSSGVSVSSIVESYNSEDNHRFAELLLLSQSSTIISLDPDLSRIGADLVALEGVCNTVGQNARHISEESSTILTDLHQASSRLSDTEARCIKAERCAKKLYRENQVLRMEQEKHKAERKILIKEIMILRDESEKEKEFHKQLFDSMNTHEQMLKEESIAAGRKGEDTNNVINTKNSTDKDHNILGETSILTEGEQGLLKDDGGSQHAPAEEEKKSYISFNPFSKFLPFVGSSDSLMTPVEDDASSSRVRALNKSNDSIVPSSDINLTESHDSDAITPTKRTTADTSTPTNVNNQSTTTKQVLLLKSTANPKPNGESAKKSTLTAKDLSLSLHGNSPKKADLGLVSSPSHDSSVLRPLSTWKRQVNGGFAAAASPTASGRAVVKVKVIRKNAKVTSKRVGLNA